MAKIFISYRRRQSGYVAASLSEKLRDHFGENSVFYDIDNIPLGVDFREHIGNEVGRCDVLLVIIGKEWVNETDERGNRRLEDSGDYVRIEIESALSRKIPVIPILIDEAFMPKAADLPKSIQNIVYRNATELRAGSDYRQHVDRLIRGLEFLFKSHGKPLHETALIETAQKPKEVVKKSKKSELYERPVLEPAAANISESDTIQEIENHPLYIISKVLDGLVHDAIFLAGEIPDDKLTNAIQTYAPEVLPDDVWLLFDNTSFGSAKDGLLITSKAVYWRNFTEKPETVRISHVRSVTYNDGFFSSEIYVDGLIIRVNTGSDRVKIIKALANIILNLSLNKKIPKARQKLPLLVSTDRRCLIPVPEGWNRNSGMNADAIIQLSNLEKDLHLIILRESKADFLLSTHLEDFAELACNYLRDSLSNPSSSNFAPTKVGGFPALEFYVRGVISEDLDLKYLYACVETHKNYYKIVGWAITEIFDQNEPEIRRVIDSLIEI